MRFFNINIWYWTVQDTNPSTHVWSSASGTFVVLADATYTTWLSAGNVATTIDTFANLMRVIADAATLNFRDLPSYAAQSSATHISLSNPVAKLTSIAISASNKNVVLPAMNLPGSIPIGIPILIYNAGPKRIFIVNNASSFLIDLGVNDIGYIILIDNTTANGLFDLSYAGTSIPSANTAGNIVIDQGSTYSSASISGDGVLAANGTFTVTKHGTTTNDNAAAGIVGEYSAAENSVSLTTNTATDITSLSLTAGDWDVWGTFGVSPAGTTTLAAMLGWLSATSATIPGAPNGGGFMEAQATLTTGGAQFAPVGTKRFSLASTTTVYLSGYVTFGVSTCSGVGGIYARRVR